MSYIEKALGHGSQYAGLARCSRCGAELPPTAKHASPAQCIETLLARVAELESAEAECGRLRLALRNAERVLANGEGIVGDDTFISRNGLAMDVLNAALAPRAEEKP